MPELSCGLTEGDVFPATLQEVPVIIALRSVPDPFSVVLAMDFLD